MRSSRCSHVCCFLVFWIQIAFELFALGHRSIYEYTYVFHDDVSLMRYTNLWGPNISLYCYHNQVERFHVSKLFLASGSFLLTVSRQFLNRLSSLFLRQWFYMSRLYSLCLLFILPFCALGRLCNCGIALVFLLTISLFAVLHTIPLLKRDLIYMKKKFSQGEQFLAL